MNINANRRVDLEAAKKINGAQVEQLEHEAFWMEDKPGKVKWVINKYCF